MQHYRLVFDGGLKDKIIEVKWKNDKDIVVKNIISSKNPASSWYRY